MIAALLGLATGCSDDSRLLRAAGGLWRASFARAGGAQSQALGLHQEGEATLLGDLPTQSTLSRALDPAGGARNAAAVAVPQFEAEVDGYAPGRAEHFRLQWYLERGAVLGAWGRARSLSEITVAVLDTGVAYEDRAEGKRRYVRSPDLREVQFVAGYDFINDDAFPNDDNQHGTFMASVVGARGGIAGVAPGVRIMPVKVLDEHRAGTEKALVDGIEWAVSHGADVINLSLSFPVDYEPGEGLRRAVQEAARKGVVLVAAAGNDGGAWVSYPAAFPEVLAVAATRMDRDDAAPEGGLRDVLARYSNYGDGVDLLAPGGALEQDVNGDGHPDGILAMTHDPESPERFGYWFQVGTSPAAAIVSGVAALLLASGCPPERVGEVLRRSARYLPVVGPGSQAVGLLDAAAAMRLAAILDLRAELGPQLRRD